MRNRLAVLSEAYAYAPYKDRVLATRDFVRECLAQAAAHKDQITRLIDEADRTVVKSGRAPARIASPSAPAQAAAQPRAHSGLPRTRRERPAGQDRHTQGLSGPAHGRFRGHRDGPRPFAYLLPSGFANAAANLKRHGIDVQELREDLDLDVEVYRVDEVGKPASSGWDRQDVVELRVDPRQETRRVAAGTLLIKTAQPLGNLVVYLLEPRSEDGLGAWKFFGTSVQAGADFPVLRGRDSVPMTTTAAEPLDEERRHDLPSPSTWRPAGAAAGYSQDHPFRSPGLMVSIGCKYATGSCSRSRRRPDGLAHSSTRKLWCAGSERLPTIDEGTAQAIAEENLSFDMNASHTGFLFHHNDDLYYATFDGTTAVRLTDHPGTEHYPRFSPDGRSVAFIRDHDLYVVDIASPRERALTTGGTETLRHGMADWVYFEEIFNRHWPAFWWSPDSKRIALMEFDDSPVGKLTMLNDTSSPRKVEQNNYPRSGEPNPKVRFGIVDAAGGSCAGPIYRTIRRRVS